MDRPEVLIVGGARTPMTDYVGALKDISALELGAIAARGAFARTGVRPEWIDHVVVGNVLQTSADAIYGARHVALKAGVPVEIKSRKGVEIVDRDDHPRPDTTLEILSTLPPAFKKDGTVTAGNASG